MEFFLEFSVCVLSARECILNNFSERNMGIWLNSMVNFLDDDEELADDDGIEKKPFHAWKVSSEGTPWIIIKVKRIKFSTNF